MVFINKSFDGKLDSSNIDIEVEDKLKELFKIVGNCIEEGKIKEGLQHIFDFISFANKYFDEKQPWILAKTDINKCNEVLFNCCNIIYNVNTLLKPYLPFTSDKVEEYLKISNKHWEYDRLKNVCISNEIDVLFDRYDKGVIKKEKEFLLNLKNK